jgi:hypothetical protein
VWQETKQNNYLVESLAERWSWGPVEASADFLFMRGRLAFFTAACTERFPARIKFLRKSDPPKSGGDLPCAARGSWWE